MLFIFAENSDYVGQSNIGITFFSGDVSGTNRCTTISINEDSIVEYNETFNVILTENSERLMIQSGRNYTQITIIEDNDCKSSPIHARISICLNIVSLGSIRDGISSKTGIRLTLRSTQYRVYRYVHSHAMIYFSLDPRPTLKKGKGLMYLEWFLVTFVVCNMPIRFVPCEHMWLSGDTALYCHTVYVTMPKHKCCHINHMTFYFLQETLEFPPGRWGLEIRLANMQ